MLAHAKSICRVNEWLIHHNDQAPFHDSSVTTKQINDHLIANGNDEALEIDLIHGMTTLHVLSINPRAPAYANAALFDSNMEESREDST